MMHSNPGRPKADEYLPYYEQYTRLVPDGDIVATLDTQIAVICAALAQFTEAQAQWRPGPGEWDVKQIVGHVSDTERVFVYRAMCFARNAAAPLPGMDPDEFMAAANFSTRTLADVVEEFVAVRRASIALFRGLAADAWTRTGIADGNPISVRALAYIMAGHELHHAKDFPKHHAMSEGAGKR